MRRITWAFALLALQAASSALGESFNIDYRGTFGTPPPFFGALGYGAASGQKGLWNNIPNTAPFALRNLANAATPVTIEGTAGASHACNDPGTAGNDQRLMDDNLRIPPGAATVFTVRNIVVGTYWVYTYAWGPCNPADFTDVNVCDVASATCATAASCGGAWPGGWVRGTNFVCHEVSVNEIVAGSGRGDIEIRLTVPAGSPMGHLNGIQIGPVGLGPGPDPNPDGQINPGG